MNSKSTFLWFLLAAALASAIWISGRYFEPEVPGEKPLFAGLHAAQVTRIQVIPAGGREICVLRTNQSWRLVSPIVYPAQASAIEGLLGTLEKLTPALSLSATEMSDRKNTEAELGFRNPQFSLDVAAGNQTWHLQVGKPTAPGDGVYVRVVGAAGAAVTDPAWLNFLPHEAGDWRDTSLVEVPDTLDWLVVTNGTQVTELRRDLTNRLWHLVRPLAARANNTRILAALQQLRNAKLSRFVSDDPKADLAGYGLDPASLSVWLGSDTNLLAAVHLGKEVPAAAGECFARREGWSTVVAAPKEPLLPWRGTVNEFRDPNLLELTAPVAEIEVRGEVNFNLQSRGSNLWSVAGEKFAADPDLVKGLIQTLANQQVVDFVRDTVPTPSLLQSYGLLNPSRTITLRSAVGDTNRTLVQVLFGATTNNQVYVKRSDEDFVYAVAADRLGVLPLPSDYFRVHRIWNFSETNVALVTLSQNGLTRQLLRTGTNQWSLAAGSTGIINSPALEETLHRLGDLSAFAWIGRNFKDEDVGLTTNSLAMTIELKSGAKWSLAFGREMRVPSLNTSTALAVVTLEGQRWAMVFPPALCPIVAENLTIPASVK